VLYELYGDELVAEERETGGIPVTRFQQHGVWRALRILDQCGGVLIADGVGLGKTFLAGEIIRRYLTRRQRVLLVCPAALRDSTWDSSTASVMSPHLRREPARRGFGGTELSTVG
jgi:hypothetical protein